MTWQDPLESALSYAHTDVIVRVGICLLGCPTLNSVSRIPQQTYDIICWRSDLLCIDIVEHMCQAKALQHQVASWLQQLPHNPVWLRQVPLEQQHPPPILQAVQGSPAPLSEYTHIQLCRALLPSGAPHASAFIQLKWSHEGISMGYIRSDQVMHCPRQHY